MDENDRALPEEEGDEVLGALNDDGEVEADEAEEDDPEHADGFHADDGFGTPEEERF